MYLYEYQEISSNLLTEYIKKNKPLHKYFKEDWGKVKARQYCGVLNLDDEDFLILPKISNKNETNLDIFMYMLMYAYNIKLENEQLASCKNHKHNIIEVFVQMFAKNLLKELQKGIYKEYVTQQDNITTLRGKYLVNENVKFNFTKNNIYCEFDEFSMNNDLNQFFIYSINVLIRCVKDKKILKQCQLIFDEVEIRQFDSHKVCFHFNRLNQRFKESFEFALLLLNQFIPLLQKDKKSFAFLFDMNVLFERFIARLIKEQNQKTKVQNQDSYNDLVLKPDILLPNMIIDTKYKKLGKKESIKSEDKYQMYVYGKNYQIKNTMLLYPKYENHFDKKLLLGKEDKINLAIKTIDLNCQECEYLEYINIMKSRAGGFI